VQLYLSSIPGVYVEIFRVVGFPKYLLFPGTALSSQFNQKIVNKIKEFVELCKSNGTKKIMLDSGAFTLQVGRGINSKGVSVWLKDKEKIKSLPEFYDSYLKYVAEFRDIIDVFVELDVYEVFGVEKQDEMFNKLCESAGGDMNKVLRVWHVWFGKDMWYQLCDTCKYVGMSNVRTTESELRNELIAYAYNKKVKTHLFGVGTGLEVAGWFRYVYSADSTSHGLGRYSLLLSNDNFGRLRMDLCRSKGETAERTYTPFIIRDVYNLKVWYDYVNYLDTFTKEWKDETNKT